MKYKFIIIAILFGYILEAQPLANVSYLIDSEISFVGGLNPVINNGKVLLRRMLGSDQQEIFYLDLNTKNITILDTTLLYVFDLQDDGILIHRGGSSKVRDSNFNTLFNGKHYRRAYKIKGGFLVQNTERQYLIIDNAGNEKLIHPSNNLSLEGRNEEYIFLLNDETNILSIFNQKGKLKAKIEDCKLAQIGKDGALFAIQDESQSYGEYSLFNTKGKKIRTFEGSFLNEMSPTHSILELDEGKNILYKGSNPVKLKNDINPIKFLNDNLILFQNSRNKYGVMQTNREILLNGIFKKIDFFDEKYLLTYNSNAALKVFDLKGQELELPVNIKQNFFGIHKIKITENFVVYLTQVNEKKYCVFDDKWQLLKELETDNKNPKFYERHTGSFKSYPIELIDIYSKSSESNDEYFMIANSHYSKNIVDIDKRNILEKDYKFIVKLSKTLFMIGDNRDKMKLIEIIK